VDIRDGVRPVPVVTTQTNEAGAITERDRADAGASWRSAVRSRGEGGTWREYATGSAVPYERETDVRREPATPCAAPQTDDEPVVAAGRREMPGMDEVGGDDGFFEPGGHSPAAVRIGAGVRNRCGAASGLRRFLHTPTPTVANTATPVAGGAAADGVPALRRGEATGPAEPETLSDAEVEAQLQELLAAESAAETNDDQENGA
jgi:hypothetical protein